MKPIIKLENVTYSYRPSVEVLKHINLTINPGEDIAIIGHNGSGKSTLGKLIISLLKPRSGRLLFNGIEINHKNDNLIRAKTGIVFQNPDNQFVGVSVADDIAFGLENQCVPHEKMEEIIKTYAEKVGVLDLLNKAPENLSGGQKQRVALAGILAMLPDLIVFDEALAMLDPKGKQEISELINAIKQEHPRLTIIRITHDLDEAFHSQRVIVLDYGEIVLDDTPAKVFQEEATLKRLGLKTPFIVELNNALMKAGLIKEHEYQPHKLVEKLCK
ncbi:MAG: energy-coupling factor transporter ATPase [Bacilli bacterium]|nr:energy-coupling factor transporter ATPase [Bacilli bacterium]